MLKNKSRKLFVLLSIAVLLSVSMLTNTASALLSQSVTSWYWTSDTNASATAVGDVNADTKPEIVSVGYFSDGSRWNAQLVVWNASTLVAEAATSWFWTSNTQAVSVAIGDVDGDSGVEIVSGGSFFDGTRWNAQLITWNGSTLVAEKATYWYWTSNTQISSVAVANISGGVGLDIVTGGAYFDGTRWNSQLIVWNGSTLVAQRVTTWFWTSNTYINSVAIASITGGPMNILTGGAFFDGTRYNSQLIIWDAASLAVQSLTSWYWTGDTEITSLAVGNLTGGPSLRVVTTGTFFDGTRTNAQLIVWDASTLVVQMLQSWYTTSNTNIASVTIGNFSGGPSLDIVTGGTFNDGVRNNGQVIAWNGATLLPISAATWFITSDTQVNSVGIVSLSTLGGRIIAGGSYFDTTRSVGSITMWG